MNTSLRRISVMNMALIAMLVIWPISWAIVHFRQPVVWVCGAFVTMLAGWMGPRLIQFALQMQSDFAGARADSSRVRETLGRIAIERWENEAYWVGHGIVENGPHLVEYMPIGSHHSWYGLLFVKGLAGFLALLLPLLLSAWAIIFYGNPATCRIGLSMLLVLVMYSFGENLEVLAYLYWPALLIIGMALKTMPRAGAPHFPDRRQKIGSSTL